MRTLYLTDLDGTLLNDKGKVDLQSAKVINKLIDEGMLFSIATARSAATVGPLLKNINIKLPVILMNGVFFNNIHDNSTISFYKINENAVAEALKVFEEQDIFPFMYCFNGNGLDVLYKKININANKIFFDARNSLSYKKFAQVEDFHVPKDSYAVYFNIIDGYNVLAPLIAKLEGIDGLNCTFYPDSYTDNWFLEVFSHEASKAMGMKKLMNYCHADRVIVFGDNKNDISMFNAADEAYAVSNAVTELKKIATGIIGSNNDNGVANFLLNKFNNEVQ